MNLTKKDTRVLPIFLKKCRCLRSSKFTRCYHRNVLENGFMCPEFQIQKADAIFLDLPKPQDAIDHAAAILKDNGRLCSFSPCIEQIVATAKTLTEKAFMEIQVIECGERRFSRKVLRESVANAESNVYNTRSVYSSGAKEDRTHTGYLLFATKFVI